MKKPALLLYINKKDQLSIKADAYIVGYKKYTSFGAYRFNYEEIKELSKDKIIFVLLNSLIHEDNLQDFKIEADKLMELDVNFIVQDIGALTYMLSKISPDRIIFNPYTLICNKDDLVTYNKLFNTAVSVTDNLSIIEKIGLVNSSITLINIYGTYPIYQSYRKVVSLYEDYKNVKIDRNNLFIKEDTRNDLYPIIENEYGSFIFSHEKVNLLDHLDELSNAKYFSIDTFNCTDEEINNVIPSLGAFYE